MQHFDDLTGKNPESNINKLAKEMTHYLQSNGFKYLAYGRHRLSFKRNKIVVKVPYFHSYHNDYEMSGVEANIAEYKLYRKFRNTIDPRSRCAYAPCRLLPNKCLMMHFLESIPCDEILRFHDFSFQDGYQIGKDKYGNVKSYDYSCELY